MDTLIAIGSGAALVYGIYAIYCIGWGLGHGDWGLVDQYSMDLYFESAGTILTLIPGGKFREARARGRPSDAVSRLITLAPKTALLLRGGGEVEIPLGQVKPGDVLIVKAGASVPVDGKLLEAAYTYRIPTMKTIFKIIVPSSIPAILTGLRLGMSSAWMSVVAAEMIASSTGIGYPITLSRETANARVMYMCVLVIGVIGLIIDKGLTRLESYYLAKTRGIVDSK